MITPEQRKKLEEYLDRQGVVGLDKQDIFWEGAEALAHIQSNDKEYIIENLVSVDEAGKFTRVFEDRAFLAGSAFATQKLRPLVEDLYMLLTAAHHDSIDNPRRYNDVTNAIARAEKLLSSTPTKGQDE